MNELKNKTINATKWSILEKVSIYGIRFIVGIILARLLLPRDYGVTALITVFLAIADVFVSSGFGSSLIRAKNPTNVDFSTVFYYNLIISIICWFILYKCRFAIANFFHESRLISIIPVLSLNIIINAFGQMQRIQLMIQLNFKSQTLASLISVLIAGTISIFMAYRGYGVWALVFQ